MIGKNQPFPFFDVNKRRNLLSLKNSRIKNLKGTAVSCISIRRVSENCTKVPNNINPHGNQSLMVLVEKL